MSYAWLDLPEVRSDQFDTDEYLLGLPDGLVANLRTGAVRQMQREDYVSRCLTVAPDANHPARAGRGFCWRLLAGILNLLSICGGCVRCV